MAIDTHLPPRWAERLLQLLGAPVNAENLRLLAAWARAEGGTAKWNPLNATYPLPFSESSDYNKSLVKNYWKPVAGICATALILIQDSFGPLLGDLQAGTQTAETMVKRNQPCFHLWGTSPNTILAVLANP